MPTHRVLDAVDRSARGAAGLGPVGTALVVRRAPLCLRPPPHYASVLPWFLAYFLLSDTSIVEAKRRQDVDRYVC